MKVPAPDWAGLDLEKLTAIQRRLFDAAYSLGFMHGIDRGRELADAEAAAHWSGVVAHVRSLGKPSSVPYSTLCDRRNEPVRAERGRANERRVLFG